MTAMTPKERALASRIARTFVFSPSFGDRHETGVLASLVRKGYAVKQGKGMWATWRLTVEGVEELRTGGKL